MPSSVDHSRDILKNSGCAWMRSSKRHRNWNGMPVTSNSERTRRVDDATDSRTSHPDGLRHHYLCILHPYPGQTYSSGHPPFAISTKHDEFRGMIPGRGKGMDSGPPHALHHLKKELHGVLLRPRPASLAHERPHSGKNRCGFIELVLNQSCRAKCSSNRGSCSSEATTAWSHWRWTSVLPSHLRHSTSTEIASGVSSKCPSLAARAILPSTAAFMPSTVAFNWVAVAASQADGKKAHAMAHKGPCTPMRRSPWR